MFTELSSKFDKIFNKLRGYARLSESNIKEALKEIKVALLEADVNYRVVKDFISSIEQKSLGQETFKGVKPGQLLIKLVYDELVELLGKENKPLRFSGTEPTVFMLTGLQGSGKTTTCGKIAKFYEKKGKRPLLVAADIYRPAAIEQLKILGKNLKIPTFSLDAKPLKICQEAFEHAKQNGFDLVIIDTAGRLHIDEALMNELAEIKSELKPQEVLLVVDGMTGQDAVNIASSFEQKVGLDGVILTKMDGDTRGGAALSIRAVSGKPIKFIGVGEKTDALELFYPERIASRILGMGDVVSLVEKAQESIKIEEAEKLEKKLKGESFTLEDFYDQLQQIKRMGPLESVLGMVPGMGKFKGMEMDEKALTKVEAIICSMTKKEKVNPNLIDGSRRKRIALGSGTPIQDVNKVLKQFAMMEKMVKNFQKMDLKKLSKMFSLVNYSQ